MKYQVSLYDLFWYKLDGGTAETFTSSKRRISVDDSIYHYRTEGTLNIAKVELEHYGSYICSGWTAKNKFNLIVHCEYLFYLI